MFVNTTVVRALMALRGISDTTLANLAHVSPAQLRHWLAGAEAQSDESVPFDTQLEVLRLLGIHGEAPRGDVVHHWQVVEPLLGAATRTYGALGALLEAFGPAEVSYLAREADPVFTLRHQARFALRFASFRAVLHVQGHPLRALRFSPERFTGLSWASDAMGVLLEKHEFLALAPGHVSPVQLEGHLNAAREALQWKRLAEAAREAQVSASELLAWVGSGAHARLPHTARSAGASNTGALEPAAEPEPASALEARQEQDDGDAAHDQAQVAPVRAQVASIAAARTQRASVRLRTRSVARQA